MTKNVLNSNYHQIVEEMAQAYCQNLWVFVSAVLEQLGRDTIPVSHGIEMEVGELVVQSSLQEWGHGKSYLGQSGLLLIGSDH